MASTVDMASLAPEGQTGGTDRPAVEPSSVWVVVPAFDAEPELNNVVAALEPLGYSMVVVDDGSRRKVVDTLRSRRAHVCRHTVNLGQGAALQTGIDYALLHAAEFIVTFDADGQHCPEDIARLIEAISSGYHEIALGSRFMHGGRAENIPRSKLIALQCAVWFTRLVVGLPLSDTHNGLRAFSAGAAHRIRITQNRMSHASQILHEIAAQRIAYVEVPVTIRYTEYSQAKGQPISNAFNIVWESIAGIFR